MMPSRLDVLMVVCHILVYEGSSLETINTLEKIIVVQLR